MINLVELQDPKSLSKLSFLDRLLEGSEMLTKEVVLKNVIGAEMVNKLLHLSDESLRELCRRESFEYGFRIWTGNEKRTSGFIKQHVFTNPLRQNETIETWINRVFTNEEICFIINNAEGFSDEIAVLMSRLFKPILDKIGIPMSGLHSTSIFGNYGFTPLGIHHDSKGSFLLNLHLGPGVKKMYLWEWNHYLALGGKMNELDIEKYLPEAKEYIIEPGDVFFMPWDRFHVGYNEGYSLSMTNWFDFHSARQLVSELVIYLNTFIKIKDDFISEAVLETNHREKFKAVLEKFSFEGNRADNSLMDNLLDAHEIKMLKIFSNGGFKSVPFTLEDQESYDKTDFAFLLNKTVRNIEPFKIYSKVQDDQVYLFVRGHIRKYQHSEKLMRIVEKLNTFEPVAIRELLAGKPDNWDDDSFLFFMSTLYNFRGIELTDTQVVR